MVKVTRRFSKDRCFCRALLANAAGFQKSSWLRRVGKTFAASAGLDRRFQGENFGNVCWFYLAMPFMEARVFAIIVGTPSILLGVTDATSLQVCDC